MRKWFVWSVLMVAFSYGFAQQKWDTVPRLPEHYRSRVAAFKKLPVVPVKTIIIGNGLVENAGSGALLHDSTVLNLGIEGDITYGTMIRLKDITARKPTRVLIEIGIDDFYKGIPEENVMENIFTIAHKLRKALPSATIIVNGILPVNPTFKNFPKSYHHNDKAFTVNEQLRRYASKIGYTFIDLYSGFVDSKGLLDVKYTTDGVHLNPAGYERWSARLKEEKIID